MSDELSPQSSWRLSRKKLEHAQTEGRRALDLSVEGAKPVGLDLSIGRLSRVDALAQQHLAAARRERLHLELQIGFSRLMARPHATLCRVCQNERDA